jgi:hypothetical protein
LVIDDGAVEGLLIVALFVGLVVLLVFFALRARP